MGLRSNDAILGTGQSELSTFAETEVDDLEPLRDRILDGLQVVTVSIIENLDSSSSRLATLSCIYEPDLGT